MKRAALAILVMGVAATAWAGEERLSTEKEQTGLAVTIYNGDLALVKDARKVRLGAGENQLAWRNVSARMQPETALLRSLDGKALTLLEQNFDFDLLTPQKLLEKSVGEEIRVIKTHPTMGSDSYESATVLSANDGVVLKFNNRIETGVPGRLAFDSVPANLRDRPTLSMLLDADKGGEQGMELSYLTGGLSWKADYVAELSAKEDSLDLNGWVTLTNVSGTAYRNARLQLVAGETCAAQRRLSFRTIVLALRIHWAAFSFPPRQRSQAMVLTTAGSRPFCGCLSICCRPLIASGALFCVGRASARR